MSDKPIIGILALFEGPEELMRAAEKVRDAGYEKWDTHSPFPIHGMNEAMGMKRSKLPWLVAAAAFAGVFGGLALQGWSSAIEYPLVIAGKSYFSYQAFFPVTFACGVLLSVLASVFGMLGIINVKFHHPVFASDKFGQVTDDGFAVSILADDPRFDKQQTAALLKEIGGTVDVLYDDEEGA